MKGFTGYFMITRGLVGVLGDVARIVSPPFQPRSSISCLSFYYHMYGSMVGKLQAYLQYDGLFYFYIIVRISHTLVISLSVR